MGGISKILEYNREWSEACTAKDPDFFNRLASQQSPEYLWIGCSDSRVPATQICGFQPGEIFVHRNIANVVVPTDLNLLSVVQFAVDILRVKDVIVCGHYGCGGVRAALGNQRHGLVDNWLRHIQNVAREHEDELEALDASVRADRLSELNVLAQARNLCQTTVVQSAWERGQALKIHGMIYRLKDGRLSSLGEIGEAESK